MSDNQIITAPVSPAPTQRWKLVGTLCIWFVFLPGVVLYIWLNPFPEPIPLTPEQQARLQEQNQREAAIRQEAAANRARDQEQADMRRNPEKYLEIVNFSWSKTGFDSIMEISMSIYNPMEFDLKDIELTCRHSSSSGTIIDSNTRTIYEVFAARKSTHIRGFSMGFIHSQAESSQCRVSDASVF
jgi:hypothetical protein